MPKMRERMSGADIKTYCPEIDDKFLLKIQDFVISVGGYSFYGLSTSHTTTNVLVLETLDVKKRAVMTLL